MSDDPSSIIKPVSEALVVTPVVPVMPAPVSVGDLTAELIVFFVLLAASAFFSGSETALTAASNARMHTLELAGNKRAALVNRLRENKDRLIGSLLLGNNLVNISASALATAVLINLFGEAGIAYATIAVTILILIFSEVMPKTLALLNPDRMALFVAPVVGAVVFVFSPLSYMVKRIVDILFRILGVDIGNHGKHMYEEELRGAIELMGSDDIRTQDIAITEEQATTQETKAMLRSILDLANVQVAEIMIHRRNVRTIDATLSAGRIVDEVLYSAFTRLPVWKDTPDNIIGIIHTKLLLQEIRNCGGNVAQVNIYNAMMEPWFIPESTTLFDQLQAFRNRREHFAVVVDEYGVLRGVVTLEDILEEIVGQIDDEHDVAVSGVKPQPDGSFLVDGKVTIRDLNRELDWGLPDDEYSTLAGLLLYESQRIPLVGQIYTFYDFRFEILKKQRNQIALVRVSPPAARHATAAG